MGSSMTQGYLLSPADINADRGPNVIAASIVLLILPTVAVGLRLCSRWMSRAGFWVSYIL